MLHNNKILPILAALVLPNAARAQLLDALLPADVPGYGEKFSVIAEHKDHAPGATGWEYNGITAVPSLALTGGYDSAPNAAAASAVARANPSLLLTDPVAGFGAYAMAGTAAYPQNRAQNTTTAILAAGERVTLPAGTLTLSTGYMRGAETGFTLGLAPPPPGSGQPGPGAPPRPLGFTVQNYRASADLSQGEITATPDLSLSLFAFPNAKLANRQDLRAALTLGDNPGGSITYLLRLGATQSTYRMGVLNADDTEALAGLRAEATGLWTVSLLAGAAQRHPAHGPGLTAPVLEARLDWRPTSLDQLSLTLRHEIDNPEQISPAPFTLTAINCRLSHVDLENVTIFALAGIDHAAYTNQPLHENLVTGGLEMQWQVKPSLTLVGNYSFNDRLADNLAAASQHVITAGMTWTP